MGCVYNVNCDGSFICTALIYIEFVLGLALGSVLPIVLYITSRGLSRDKATLPHHIPSDHQGPSNKRQKNGNKDLCTDGCHVLFLFGNGNPPNSH